MYAFGNFISDSVCNTVSVAEPTDNLADVPEDQIVETIETSDGPVASTVEHVHEIAKDVRAVHMERERQRERERKRERE